MQHVVLILPDSENRLPDAEALRKNGFRVSSALDRSADQVAMKPDTGRDTCGNQEDAPCTTGR